MNRRQLAFVIILNAFISLTIAVTVVWVVEQRRLDTEPLAALETPNTAPIPTFTSTPVTERPPEETASPTPIVESAGETAGEDEVYIVQSGDILSAIAARFGVSMQAIMDANNLTNPDFVFVGQRLVIPRGGSSSALPTATHTPGAAQTGGAGLRIASFIDVGTLASEGVRIANDSDLVVNLQGWRLEKENGPAYQFGGVSLFPGAGITLYTGTGVDTSVALYWNQAAPLWERGAVARLVNPQGQEISRLTVP
uniref:LysM peptidoglycan-binding domain-containing protein n=1 Tax=Caldilinea aerophila TaxID=133453 RepID=A0A7C1FRC7_9CHLR